MPVGEVFLGAFLQVLFDRLAPHDLSFFPRPDLVPELQRWNRKLSKIEAVLADAEEKQLSGDKLVKMWLDDLQDLAYDLDDLLDEFATEELERKLTPAEPQSTSILEDAGRIIMSCTAKVDDMKSRIDDISGRLDQLWQEIKDLGLIAGGTSSTVPVDRRPPTTSLPTETTVFGRDGDASKILDMVLSTGESNNANFRVISIVGMAGIGKTTLAQKVFNDEAVKDFNPRAWTCVSNDFDVLRISKSILQSITGSPCILTELDAVQRKLREEVAGKRFLLVLDDVWSKKDRLWEILRSPFKAGAVGSKIIVTTREKVVASTMGALKESHILELLSDVECWSLFKAHAFEYREIASYGDIELIRQKVIERCKGLPLAVKTLAGLLRSKQEDQWLEVLSSKMWDLVGESNDIPATLKLSYYYLPSHLKRCFAHCAIFLEDYEFLEEELIHLWMAEGLIQQAKGNQQLEDLGHDYFDALLSRSFFQQSSVNKSKHTMHDLIHDLAKWASGGTCYHLEDMTEANKQLRSFKKVRHLSFARGHREGKCKFEVLKEVDQHLRTFLPLYLRSTSNKFYGFSFITQTVILELLPKFKKLRMLSLEGYYVTELPESFGDLRHLRFLNLSGTMIKSLPESTSSLLNLRILKLRGCSRLKELPSKISNLINLRYLDIRGVHLDEMPLGIYEIKCLQYLPNFVVGNGFGIGLNNLKNLKSLSGEQFISSLENVVDLHETSEMMLTDKQKLKVLQLEWNSQFDDTRNEVREKEVLGLLRPHPNLEKLTIIFYGGLEFPSWVGESSFSKMTSLTLYSCEKCTILPSLGMLGSLKDLRIGGMKGLKSVGKEICGQRCSTPFQSLQTLCFVNMQEWEQWEPIEESEYGSAFPCLREFSIEYCPKLSGRLPDCLPSLEKLVIKRCYQLEVSISSLPMLCELEIEGCKGLACNSPTDSKSLKSMTLADISEFGNWLRQQNFLKVECLKLKITSCEQLINLWQLNETFLQKPPQGLHNFISITELQIENCSNLVSFPEVCFLYNLTSLPKGMNDKNASLVKDCNSLTFIVPASLKKLEIKNCEKLEYLWDDNEESCTSVVDEENPNSTNTSLLEYLYVYNCPSFKCLSSSGHLPHTLCTLSLVSLPELESIVESFHYLGDCLGEEGPPNTNLSEIEIVSCEKLKALPNWFHSLNSLKRLVLRECPSMSSFPEEGFPTNLTSLSIEGLNVKMYKAVLEWGLHNLTSLTSLRIGGLPEEAESFPQQELEMTFPPSLARLYISLFPNLKCLMGKGFQNLKSLEYLSIEGCPNLTSSLQSLHISSCSNLKSFLELALPSSIQSLLISFCPNLKSFSKVGLPSSLSKLEILFCGELRSFPEQGLPSSLLELTIHSCPKLKEECKRDKGKEWSKISHIPCVEIDGTYIYDPLCWE